MQPNVRAALLLAALLLNACGGGGGEGDAATPQTPPLAPATYSLGGTVSGLAGSVTLQANGGATLAVSSNGPFTFPSRLAGGTTYSVTVSSQPSDLECAVVNGSGVLSASVSNLTVTCATPIDAYYVPLNARVPRPSFPGGFGAIVGPVVSSAGLYAFANRRIEQPLKLITREDNSVVSLVPRLSVSNGPVVTAAAPGALLYRTLNARDGDHLWSVSLAADSTLVPRQVSTLTLSMDTVVAGALRLCGKETILRKVDDPSTAFFILSVADGPPPVGDEMNPCLGATRRTLVVSLEDAATAPPRAVINLSGIEPIYKPDGTLAGMITVDAARRALVMYPDASFTNPVVLLDGVDASSQAIREELNFGSPWTFLAGPLNDLVVTLFDGSGGRLYHVDYRGTVTALPGKGAFRLGAELVIVEYPDPVDVLAVRVSSVALDGSRAPRTLFADTRARDCGGGQIIWFKASEVWLHRHCSDPRTNATTTTLLSVPTNGSRELTAIATVNDAAFLGFVGDNMPFRFSEVVSQSPARYRYSSLVLDSTGATRMPRTEGMKIELLDADHLIAVRDIPGTGTVGGEIAGATLGSGRPLAFTSIRTSDGAAITLAPDAEHFSAIGTGFGRAIAQMEDSEGWRSSLLLDLDRQLAVRFPADSPELTLISALTTFAVP
jgi:hypothetical protein